MINFTKKEVAEFYGITTATLFNWEKEAKNGSQEYARRLSAYYDHYIRTQAKQSKGVKILKDTEDGETYYLIKE